MGSRFVLANNISGTKREVFETIFVVQGRTDIEKSMLIHAFSNICQQTITVFIAVAAIFL